MVEAGAGVGELAARKWQRLRDLPRRLTARLWRWASSRARWKLHHNGTEARMSFRTPRPEPHRAPQTSTIGRADLIGKILIRSKKMMKKPDGLFHATRRKRFRGCSGP